MTVDEAAKQLGCSPGLVYKLCERRLIAFHRIGVGRGTIRISPEQLDAYRRGCEVLPLAEGLPEPEKRPKRGKAPAVRDRVAEYQRRRGVK